MEAGIGLVTVDHSAKVCRFGSGKSGLSVRLRGIRVGVVMITWLLVP